MNDHPILFKADMVRAIRDGSKTQTRRVMRRQPPKGYTYRGDDGGNPLVPKDSGHYWTNGYAMWRPRLCPYGVPGDLLWVKEPFRIESDDYHQAWVYGRYNRDNTAFGVQLTDAEWSKWEKWKKPFSGKSSLYMFKSLARLWLKVKSVRVERVQEISLEDIKAEGVTFDLIRSLLKPTKTKQGHWISGGDYNQAEDYCYECAKKIVEELNAADGDKDYVVDGGWENHDSDWIAHCEKCECLLNYWPTDHLFEAELDGFETYGEITELHNEDRYSFDTLCCAAPDQDEAIQNRVLKLCWRYLWDFINAKPKPCYSKKEITHYESYPWEDIQETKEYRGKSWRVYGNPWNWAVEFERTEKEQ